MKKSVKSLLKGNSFAQVLQLISLLFLTHIYSPDDFGLLGTIQASAVILVAIMTLQMHLLIPLSKDKKEAFETLIRIIIFIGLFSLIAIIPLYFYNKSLILILALFLSLTNSFKSYLVFEGNFSVISVFYVIRVIIIIMLQVIFSFFEFSNGLLFAVIAGEAFSSIYLLSLILRERRKIKFRKTYFTNMIQYIKDKKQFTIYGTAQELVSLLNFSFALLFFSYFYNDNIVGQYSIANRLVWAPTILVSSSLAQVYYYQFAQKSNWSVFYKWVWFDRKYMFIIIAIIVFYSSFSNIIIQILGDNWKLAESMIFYLLFSSAFFLYSLPYRVAFRALENVKNLFFIEIIFTIILAGVCSFTSSALEVVKIIAIISFFQSIIITVVAKNIFNGLNKND